MNVGDEILIKGKIVDLDNNSHGLLVEITGYVDKDEERRLEAINRPVRFWIHRLDS